MQKERLYYLDWLRIGAFGLLILFHCMRFFDFFPWHIKNQTQSELATQIFLFTTSWRMPLIFFVSGAGTYFAILSSTLQDHERHQSHHVYQGSHQDLSQGSH